MGLKAYFELSDDSIDVNVTSNYEISDYDNFKNTIEGLEYPAKAELTLKHPLNKGISLDLTIETNYDDADEITWVIYGLSEKQLRSIDSHNGGSISTYEVLETLDKLYDDFIAGKWEDFGQYED